MDFKKIYSKVKVAYGIVMMGVDFYQNHKEEIKPILSKAKDFAISVKDSWNNYWDIGFKPINYLENVNVSYDEVVDWIADKDIVRTKDVEERFNLNPIDSLLVLRQLETNNLAEQVRDQLHTFKITIKTSRA